MGPSGSGKSTLATALVPRYDHTVTLDPKGEFRLPGAVYCQTAQSILRRSQDLRDARAIIYQPAITEIRSRVAHERVLWWIYLRGNTMLYIDEVYTYATGSDLPDALFAIITRGRSRNVGGIFATQRPSRIPLVVLSEARCAFIFRLMLAKDRKRIEETFFVSEADQLRLGEFEFLFAIDGRVSGPYRLAV